MGFPVYDWIIWVITNDRKLKTIEEIKEFMESNDGLEFAPVYVEEKKS